MISWGTVPSGVMGTLNMFFLASSPNEREQRVVGCDDEQVSQHGGQKRELQEKDVEPDSLLGATGDQSAHEQHCAERDKTYGNAQSRIHPSCEIPWIIASAANVGIGGFNLRK